MAKRWNLVAHPAYFDALRRVVLDADRYTVAQTIWDRLEETDDPAVGVQAVAGRPGRYELTIGKYLLTFGIPAQYSPPEPRPNDIDLFLIELND